MRKEEKPKPKSKPTDRVCLNEEASMRSSSWVERINAEFEGQKISKNDFINWLISSRPLELSSKEIAEIKNEYFDPARALALLTKRVREAQKRGEKIDISTYLNKGLLIKPKKRKPKCKTNSQPIIPHISSHNNPVTSKKKEHETNADN